MSEGNLIRVYFTEEELRRAVSFIALAQASYGCGEPTDPIHLARKLESHLPESLGIEKETK